MKARHILIAAGFCLVLSSFAFANGTKEVQAKSTSGKAINIALAMQSARTDQLSWAIANRIKDGIEKASNGEITVQILGPEVGNVEQELQGTSAGEYQMNQQADTVIEDYAPKYAVTAVPFLFPNPKSLQTALNGSIGQKINEALIKNGNVRILGRSMRGARELTANKPIRTLADLKGLKLRVPEIKTWVQIWKQLGALPTPVAWGEVYSALQTGLVDGQENPIGQIWEAKLYEVQKYIMMTNHLNDSFRWIINNKFYERLSKKDQQIVAQATREACIWGTAQLNTTQKERIQKMEKAGVKIIYPQMAPFYAAARPALRQIADTQWAPDVKQDLAKLGIDLGN